jgi:hypothetical protein
MRFPYGFLYELFEQNTAIDIIGNLRYCVLTSLSISRKHNGSKDHKEE